jgi:signal transduction histidine kinase
VIRGRRGLPLALWAVLLSGGPAVAVGGVAVLLLARRGELSRDAVEAITAGGGFALALTALAVFGATRFAASLRALHSDAALRLRDPSAPVAQPERGPFVTRVNTELADLAGILDALHLRVRVGDEVGQRHRRDAETAGAGVFELLSGLVAAEEGARGQLAAELHDTVAQSLMLARGLLRSPLESPADLTRLTDYVEDAEEQVRAVMARTRPPALREGDLASAVSGLAADMLARYGLTVHVDWPHSPHPLPLASAVTVYRFFQEALLNVVKHADVEQAFVTLFIEAHVVRATVRDSGPGFDRSEVRPEGGRHVGLGLLHERARLSGGALEVISRKGEGTTLALRLPRPALPRPGLVVAQPLAAPPQEPLVGPVEPTGLLPLPRPRTETVLPEPALP